MAWPWPISYPGIGMRPWARPRAPHQLHVDHPGWPELLDRAVQDLQLPARGVEPGAHPDRQGPLIVHVSHREAVGGGYAQRFEIGREHLVITQRTVAGAAAQIGELP